MYVARGLRAIDLSQLHMLNSRMEDEPDHSSDWRKGKTLVECNVYMMTNQIACDVTFVVGSERETIQAHKYILVARSSVFESMFTGPLSASKEILLSDTDPAVFKQILKFLYSDDVQITSDNVTAMLKMAGYYALYSLEDRCFHFLQSNLSAESACNTMELAHAYERNDIWDKSVEFIEIHASEVLQSTSTSRLCRDCLHHLISVAEIDVTERIIYNAAILWVENQCEIRGREATPDVRRDILGESLFEIRFPLMSPDFFVNAVSNTGLLTDKERISVLENMLCPKSDSKPFSSELRKGNSTVRRVCRFPNHGDEWKYDWKYDDAVAFTSDCNILLLGCTLYGPNTDTKDPYIVNASAFDKDRHLIKDSRLTTTVEACCDDVTYDVMFANPIDLQADVLYTVTVNISGPPSFKGLNGMSHVVVDGIKFLFSETDKSTNHTTISSGQIAGLIFKIIT